MPHAPATPSTPASLTERNAAEAHGLYRPQAEHDCSLIDAPDSGCCATLGPRTKCSQVAAVAPARLDVISPPGPNEVAWSGGAEFVRSAPIVQSFPKGDSHGRKQDNWAAAPYRSASPASMEKPSRDRSSAVSDRGRTCSFTYYMSVSR